MLADLDLEIQEAPGIFDDSKHVTLIIASPKKKFVLLVVALVVLGLVATKMGGNIKQMKIYPENAELLGLR